MLPLFYYQRQIKIAVKNLSLIFSYQVIYLLERVINGKTCQPVERGIKTLCSFAFSQLFIKLVVKQATFLLLMPD